MPAFLQAFFWKWTFAVAKSARGRAMHLATLALIFCFAAGPTLAADANINLQAFQNGNGQSANLVFGLFLGVILTAAMYLFLIWIVMRERGQVFLLALLIGLGVYIATTSDLIMATAGFSVGTRSVLANYSLILACLFSAFFTFYFLEIDLNFPLARVPLMMVGMLLVGLLFYSPLDADQNLTRFVLPVVSTLVVIVILVTGVVSFYLNVHGSFSHIVAFVFFICGVLADPLYVLGYVESPSGERNLTYISFAMSALTFALVIASQFAARQEEKEKELAISNERFTLATRGSNEGLFDWDLKVAHVFFSDQFRKILGLRIENAPKGLKIWMRLIYEPDRRIVRDALRRFRRSADINTINVEYRVILANNNRRWLHTKAVAVRDPRSRRIQRLVGSTSDITARKQSEVALRASEARFRSITEAHPVPVMIVNLRLGTLLYASPGAEQLLGLRQDQLIHEYFDRFLTDPEARGEILQAMADGREVNLKEVTLDRGDGRKLDAALSARRISYQSEDSMVLGLYDLTERKQAEAQISRQQEALQQSEKMAALGGLLAGVAHELNNPLSVVVGQTTLLMEGSSEPKVVMRAEKIFKAADRCARIVKSFLALARRKPPERKAVNLNSVVNNALELLGYQLRTNNVTVTLSLEEKLPDITGDSDQLTQVITNLVMNASQAMESWTGTRNITISSYHEDRNVFLKCIDTGPGVPQEIRTRVFEPFFTTKSGKGGTGVGLSLCLNIIASHDGQMLLEETPGGGATFFIQVPMSESVQAPDAPEKAESLSLGAIYRILLVDDEVELAQTLADLMEPEGHTIDIAANGQVALDKLRKNTFDVIVSDLRMPVLDGPGLYEELRRELPSYLNKIIYVTGDTLSSHVQTFLSQYPVPVVEKPYRVADVRKAISNLLTAKPDASPEEREAIPAE